MFMFPFIADFDNLCLLSFFLGLASQSLSILFFFPKIPLLAWFSLFFWFLLHWFHYYLYDFHPSACFGFILLWFFKFIKVEALVIDLRSFSCPAPLAVLNCSTGKNFTNITYISGHSGAGSTAPSPSCTATTPDSVVRLWLSPRPGSCCRQVSALAPPRACGLAWWSGPHWVSGFLLMALWNGSVRITPKNLYVESSQTGKNSGLSEPRSRPARPLATHWRLQANISWLTPWWTGLPQAAPLETGPLWPPWCTRIWCTSMT